MTATVRLRKGEDRRLRKGHLWAFSNEIDTRATPLGNFQPGEKVRVESARGDTVGYGYINPHSLIAVRLCGRDEHVLSHDWFRTQVQSALDLRESLYTSRCYRLIHGEGDWLPGLVVDRYGDVLVVQITTAGMEAAITPLMEVLCDVTGVSHVLLHSDAPLRELEQLPLYRRVAVGEQPAELIVHENDLEFAVQYNAAQKTGWFFDHRENRAQLKRFVRDKRVLDCYSYAGGWGVTAASYGAESVLCVDSSADALGAVNANAERNRVADRVLTRRGDAVDVMRELIRSGETFDVVLLDPPAFIKRKKDLSAGLRHYQLNNRLAVELLKPGGLLFTASCSQPLTSDALAGAVRDAAGRNKRRAQVLAALRQAPDHPVHAAMPETDYLNGFIARLLR